MDLLLIKKELKNQINGIGLFNNNNNNTRLNKIYKNVIKSCFNYLYIKN